METKTYKVNYIKNYQINITGKGNHKYWKKAELLTDFVSAWDIKKPSKIEFKALWDTKNLYFLFKVFDSKVHINITDNSVESIGSSDRVELFFRTDVNMSPYYCLEIDPIPRVMDFIAYPNKQFDFNWKWPSKDINIKSDIQVDYFTVEGSISISSIKKFNLLKDNKIETGIFRAKYNKSKNLNYEPTWISWVEPQSETPNFHIPSSFGTLILVQ
mgnify:CR=1 FL=1